MELGGWMDSAEDTAAACLTERLSGSTVWIKLHWVFIISTTGTKKSGKHPLNSGASVTGRHHDPVYCQQWNMSEEQQGLQFLVWSTDGFRSRNERNSRC